VAAQSLRRSWIVIVGSGAPAAEVSNGALVIKHIRRKLNLTPFKAFPDTFSGLPYLVKNSNVVTIGGPRSNEWCFNLNEFTDPKYGITIKRERGADETWADYLVDGFTVNDFIVGTTHVPIQTHRGLLGTGQQNGATPAYHRQRKRLFQPNKRLFGQSNRLRPLQVTHIGGTQFEDTCTMVKAFLADADPGFYQCDWPEPADPTYAACPASPTYTKLTV